MAKTILGKVAMTPKGLWSATIDYEGLDVVESSEGSFIAKKASKNIPVSNTEYWQKIADRGPAGEGNVTVTENGLEANKLYLFKPAQNNKALGTFESFTAAEQEQANWTETNSSSKAFIKNKPSNVSTSVDGFMSKADKTKLDGIETGSNKYVHPDNASTRHVSDSEKNTWNGKAESNHNHTGVYQPAGSYAASNHNHDSAYAATSHNHDSLYQAKESGKGLSEQNFTSAFKDMLDYQTGVNTASSLSNLQTTKQVVNATVSTNQTISLNGTIVLGRVLHVFVKNSSTSDLTITIPTTGAFTSLSGASKTLKASNWLEINIACYETGKYIIRAAEGE